ncbi:MAG: DNA-3-methyladenine glycosylase 2 family protein [Candidatus Eremiobacteraeota bacterium]|nr:DNA-3-methyladenine glycosylase 2 family protein [Candidatus Eremiobacteraeota bacterium]
MRRLASNVVDVVGPGGTYYRAVQDGASPALLAVRAQRSGLELRATGARPERWVPVVERLLGTAADLSEWYRCSSRIEWLQPISEALRGLKPPRYPSLWEACAHAIVFQQISIHAAASIMRRAVEALGEPVSDGRVRCLTFPDAERWHDADDALLRGAGLSRNKIGHLRSAAAEFAAGSIAEADLQRLSSTEAARRLCGIRGIGPWSASVILLRGMGRLDVFPMRDSGVARSLALLSGDAAIDQTALLERLGRVRGMLYYHLLLGRLRNLVPV